jgi:hypothetical protein
VKLAPDALATAAVKVLHNRCLRPSIPLKRKKLLLPSWTFQIAQDVREECFKNIKRKFNSD